MDTDKDIQLKAGDELGMQLPLQELLDGITPENCYPATDWGKPVLGTQQATSPEWFPVPDGQGFS